MPYARNHLPQMDSLAHVERAGMEKYATRREQRARRVLVVIMVTVSLMVLMPLNVSVKLELLESYAKKANLKMLVCKALLICSTWVKKTQLLFKRAPFQLLHRLPRRDHSLVKRIHVEMVEFAEQMSQVQEDTNASVPKIISGSYVKRKNVNAKMEVHVLAKVSK